MDDKLIKEKVLQILEVFGMSGLKAAEAMNVTYAVFRNKKNDNNAGHTFNEKNYQDLVAYIKEQCSKLN